MECPEHIGCKTAGARMDFKFESWAKTYNLECDQRIERTHGRVLAFLVNATCCLILLHLSDIWGRRAVLMLNSVLILTFLLGAAFSSTYMWKMGMLGAAFGCEGDFTPLFVFLMAESTSKHNFILSTEYKIQICDLSSNLYSILPGFCHSEHDDFHIHECTKATVGHDHNYHTVSSTEFVFVCRESGLVG